MKKLTISALALTLSIGLLAGCAGKPATSTPTPDAVTPTPEAVTPVEGAVKTGLAMTTDVSKSKDATADANGLAQADIALTAVTVDDKGVITACVIDAIQSKIDFDASGKIVSELGNVATKNELGTDYGMSKASSIQKEWNEQAAAFAAYAVGKTVEELKGIAVGEKGEPTDADLAASVTVAVGGFVDGIEAAVNNAVHMGAQAGDKLALTTSTSQTKSKDAGEKEGLAEAYAYAGAITMNGETITSCIIDAVKADVKFDATGKITTDLSAAQPTKNELGDAYGMKGSSSIGKEWNEQAAAFAAYVTGKTAADVAGIAVNESGAPADADLAASVTVGIGAFQTLIEKAA